MIKAKPSFFARYRYEVTPKRVVVYPNYTNHLAANILFLLFFVPSAFLCSVFSVVMLVTLIKGTATYPAFTPLLIAVLIGIPFILKWGLSFNYNVHIIFDGGSKTILRRSYWGTRQVGTFSEVQDVYRSTAYFVRMKNSKYVRITSLFHNYDAHKYFASNVLTVINSMLGIENVQVPKPRPANTTERKLAKGEAINETIVQYSIKKRKGIMLGGLLLLLAGLALAYLAFSYSRRGLLYGLYFALIAAGGLLIIFGIARALMANKKVGLCLNSKGILFGETPIGKGIGWVEWADVEYVSTGTRYGNEVVFLHLKNKEKYMRRLSSGIAQMQVEEHGLAVTCSELDIAFDDLKCLIELYHEQYKQV